jgi:lipid A 3-O-deacylase
MQLKICSMLFVFILISIVPHTVSGNEINWRSIGLRGGVNDHRNDEDFKQYEVFASWKLPWRRQWDCGWKFGTFLEANAGVLRGGGESAFVGSIGPGIYFTGFKEKLDISMGINPTIISRHEFGDEDLGGPINFTSHIGLNFNFSRNFSIGYRLQHMSNGVFYDVNPGLNMHMIEVGYRF